MTSYLYERCGVVASDHTTADIPATAAICPLSQGQRALWFLQQLNPESAAYNIARAGTIRGDLNVSAFQSAWQRLTARHASLRSTFSLRDGEPVRVIHNHMPVAFEALDASDWSPAAVSEYLSREAAVPFDLTRGPLMRVKILKRSREEHKGLAVWHHTVTDLWSLGIMLYEMDAIYAAETAGVSAPLPPLTVAYADYVREQADTLAGPEGERLWSFWHRQLADAPQVLDLPTDQPRPAIQSWQGSSVVRRLPVGLATQLRRVAAQMKTTLHALSLSAFAALVHRYTSQDDFLIGTPRAGRSRKHFPVVGYFVNPIVIRINASGNPSFAEFLQRVGQAMVGAREHQAFPFIRIVEQLHLQRDLSRSPLYQVGFAWQKGSTLDPTGFTSFALHESGGAMTIGGLAWEFLDLERQVVPIDINLLMVEDGEELAVSAEYATELFDRTTIERMVEHFETLLKAVIDDSGTRLASLPLMTEEERDRILVAWSGTLSEKPPAPLVHEAFEATIAESGEKLALKLGDKQLSYSELNSRSNQLARELRIRGVGRNIPVALCVNRSWEMAVGLLGILKAGGVYLPVDPAYPPARNRVIIDDARPSVVLTQGEVASALSAHAPRVICLDTDWQAIARHDDSDLGLAIDAASAAYIIYTSGSTGRPKGTVVSHAALANHCREMSAHFEIRSDDRVLQFASLCFDASLEQILTTLCGGATLLPRGDDLWQPAQFHEWLAEHAITVVNIPPAYWHQWVEAYVEARVWTRLDDLRLVIVGGDVMRPETVRMWCDTPLATRTGRPRPQSLRQRTKFAPNEMRTVRASPSEDRSRTVACTSWTGSEVPYLWGYLASFAWEVLGLPFTT
jgi:non-ribosomal peptide synthetase component F